MLILKDFVGSPFWDYEVFSLFGCVGSVSDCEGYFLRDCIGSSMKDCEGSSLKDFESSVLRNCLEGFYLK